jgi:hypothetical protein
MQNQLFKDDHTIPPNFSSMELRMIVLFVTLRFSKTYGGGGGGGTKGLLIIKRTQFF